MAEDDTTNDDEKPKKSSKLPMIIGILLALVGGGGGFYAAFSGMILGTGEPEVAEAAQPGSELESLSDVAFIPVDPMVISVGGLTSGEHLRFRAQLEVPAVHKADVELIMPRIVDVLNNYLRALRLSDLEESNALLRIRSQMLRRLSVVAGEGRVNDVLIMEFVLN